MQKLRSANEQSQQIPCLFALLFMDYCPEIEAYDVTVHHLPRFHCAVANRDTCITMPSTICRTRFEKLPEGCQLAFRKTALHFDLHKHPQTHLASLHAEAQSQPRGTRHR